MAQQLKKLCLSAEELTSRVCDLSTTQYGKLPLLAKAPAHLAD